MTEQINKVLPATEFLELVATSSKRKQQILDELNEHLRQRAEDGKLTAYFPPGLSRIESEWLVDEVVNAGYKVNRNYKNANIHYDIEVSITSRGFVQVGALESRS